MNNGFQFFDIILFAMIAIFLILRLRGALGRRDGHQGDFPDILRKPSKKNKNKKESNKDYKEDNVVVIDKKNPKDNLNKNEENILEELSPIQSGINSISRADSDFDETEFISGARIAFEYILGAYASGDAKALKPLLSPEVFEDFNHSINEREQAGQKMEETLIGISIAELIEAEMEGPIAQITVKFVSDQIHALSDSDGKLVEGDPDKIVSVTDLWTFSRDTRSRDPNWLLAATSSLD